MFVQHKKRVSALSIGVAGLLAASWLVTACATPAPEGEVRELVWPPAPDEPRYYYEATIFGSKDVTEESATERLRRIATGQSERGEGLDKPFGVAARQGRVYVGDTVGRKVAVFDLVNKTYSEIGTKGVGRIAKPLGVAVDGSGRLYVVDATAKRVNVYGPNGDFVTAIGTDHGFNRPSGIAVNDSGTRIYVVDTGGVDAEDHQVHVFDGNGAHLFDFGERGDGEGEFNLPHMIAAGPNGDVYVVDGGNFRVQRFDPDGNFVMSFGDVGRQSGQFSRPKGIAVDDEGKIFIADAAFGNVQIFNENGQLLMFLGGRGENGGAGEFLLPAGLAVDETGRIYVADQFFRKLEIFRPAGVPAKSWSVSTTAEGVPAPAGQQ